MRFIIGIDLYGYGSQEVPKSFICQLENHESLIMGMRVELIYKYVNQKCHCLEISA